MQTESPNTRSPFPMIKASQLALRFISGKYQGGEFPLMPEKETIIGRSAELDMVLVEDMVSRKHAMIGFDADGVFIEDLESTNGTFVNGEKIKRARLREGDRVLIGTSILKLVSAEAARKTTGEQARRDMENVAARGRTGQVRSMSGSIEEIPLPDLLQLLGTSKKNGVLVIRTGADVGRIYLHKGLISHASINDTNKISPTKSVFRMLTWPRGSFDLEASDNMGIERPLDLPVQPVLIEAMRQVDELNRIKDRLPPKTARLRVELPLVPALRDLTASELDVFQSAFNVGFYEQVLDRSPLSDLDTAQAILKLIAGGYVRVS